MSAPEAQAPLPLLYAPRRTRSDFFVTDANRDAVRWLDDPALWPVPRTVLVGPPASGKSHLAAIFADAHGGEIIETAHMRNDGEAMFHAWNAATPARPLLFTAVRLPPFWVHGLPDLASRLAATPLVRLGDPDDALMAQVLAKCFADRGLRVGGDVIAWLTARIERSFGAATDIVARLDGLALAERRDITVPLVRALLEEQGELGL